MSPLPFISHHLFVSAAVSDGEEVRPRPQEESPAGMWETADENERSQTCEGLVLSGLIPGPVQQRLGGDAD